MNPNNLRILSGSANLPLAWAISQVLGVPLCEADSPDAQGEKHYPPGRFSDGEIRVQIQQTVRGQDVFVIQPTSPPVNDHLMELLLLVDALKRASARQVCAVIPYFGYARQDRKKTGRVPISARLVANLLETAGIDRVLTMELHAGQIQGFFNIPVDHLRVDPLFHRYIRSAHPEWLENLVVASPDLGGVWRARRLAKLLKCEIAVAVTQRTPEGDKKIVVTQVIGNVEKKRVLIVDDILASGGTMVAAAQALAKAGAREICCACAHGVFTPGAFDLLTNAPLQKVLITDTIAPSAEVRRHPLVEIVPVATYLAEAIRRIHGHESMTDYLAYSPEGD